MEKPNIISKKIDRQGNQITRRINQRTHSLASGTVCWFNEKFQEKIGKTEPWLLKTR